MKEAMMLFLGQEPQQIYFNIITYWVYSLLSWIFNYWH